MVQKPGSDKSGLHKSNDSVSQLDWFDGIRPRFWHSRACPEHQGGMHKRPTCMKSPPGSSSFCSQGPGQVQEQQEGCRERGTAAHSEADPWLGEEGRGRLEVRIKTQEHPLTGPKQTALLQAGAPASLPLSERESGGESDCSHLCTWHCYRNTLRFWRQRCSQWVPRDLTRSLSDWDMVKSERKPVYLNTRMVRQEQKKYSVVEN